MRHLSALALILVGGAASASDYYPVPKPARQQAFAAPAQATLPPMPPAPPGYMYVPVAMMPARPVAPQPTTVPVAGWAAQTSPYYPPTAPACATCPVAEGDESPRKHRFGHMLHGGLLRSWWHALDYCNPCGGTVGCSNGHYELAFVFGSCRTFFGCADATPPAQVVRQSKSHR